MAVLLYSFLNGHFPVFDIDMFVGGGAWRKGFDSSPTGISVLAKSFKASLLVTFSHGDLFSPLC